MSDLDATIAALREAVRLAPDNLPLLKHFIKTLVDLTRYAEAEATLNAQLVAGKNQAATRLLLAEVFYRQGKDSHAAAIVDTLVSGSDPLPAAMVLQAKLLYRAGEVHQAVAVYRLAIDADEIVADQDFERMLGIDNMTLINDGLSSELPEEFRAEPVDEVIDGRIRQASEEFGDSLPVPLERPHLNFEQVGGMESVKEQVRIKIIFPITHAEMFAAYGKKVGGGILMYGPPGCGKTLIARATAGEVKANFLSIGIEDVLDMWLGNSERNLHQIFEQARRNRPCVLFFDEVDALGANRHDMKTSAGRHLVNQFLSEMDGVKGDNEGLLILGATNAPWHVDGAFRRPGRFDRVLFVPPPDATARESILNLYLAGKPNAGVDVKKIASKTADYSGADLKAVVDNAIEAKLHEAMRTGKPGPLTTNDLLTALKTIRPTTREWFATAKNHALFANQGGIYDDILEYLKLK